MDTHFSGKPVLIDTEPYTGLHIRARSWQSLPASLQVSLATFITSRDMIWQGEEVCQV